MPTAVLRWLPSLTAAGPRQMAADEALLAVGALPVARLYDWQPAGVSLGCFQDYAAIVATLPRPLPIVRRITGGGAIWHSAEVTYAVVFELDQVSVSDGDGNGNGNGNGNENSPPTPLQRAADAYAPLHRAIMTALAHHGSTVQRQDRSTGDRRYRTEPRCFASPATDDLVVESGAKVLGSAARARGNRVLIHGSLKLASNEWDGDAVRGCGLDRPAAEQVLREGICAFLGATAVAADWSAAESASTAAIEAARYGDSRWVQHREGLRP